MVQLSLFPPTGGQTKREVRKKKEEKRDMEAEKKFRRKRFGGLATGPRKELRFTKFDSEAVVLHQ